MSYTPEIENKISILNSTTITPISGGTIFQGVGEDVSKYGRVGVSVWTPFGESTDGILTMEVSRDGVNWGGPNRTFVDTSTAQPHMWSIVEKYFRIKYTHGSTSASTLVIQTQYSVNIDILLGHQLDEVPLDEHEGINVKAIGWGKNPDGIYGNVRLDGVGFQTKDNLTSGSTFNSNVIDAQGYTQIQTHIVSDQDGTLGFKFCSTANCSGTTVGQNGVERYLEIPYMSSDGFQLYSAPIFTPYVQSSFTNDGNETTTHLFYETKLLTKSLSGQLLATNSFISPSMVANLGRNILVGQDLAGNFRNISVDSGGDLNVRVDGPLTAFGELSVAEMTPLLQIQHPYELNLDLLSTGSTTGSGSVTYNTGTTNVEVNSGAATSSSGVVKTRKLVKYRNGQGIVTRFTSIFDVGTSGNEQWIGWADSNDGYLLGYSGTTFGILKRNSLKPSNPKLFIPQNEWNIDVMDGTLSLDNPSGQLLNPRNGNVYQIQSQWLGFGAVNFFIESEASGKFEPVHQIKYTNQNDVVSSINPTFPLWIESTNTTNNTNITIKNPSLAAFNEGIVKYTGPTKSFGNSKASTTNTVIFSLENPTTYKGRVNRSRIKLQSLNVFSDQSNANPVRFEIQLDPTLASTSFSSFGSYTTINTDTSGTLSTAGIGIFQVGVTEVGSDTIDLTNFDIFLNPGETLSVVSNGSNNGTGASLTWVEDL